MRNTVLQYTIKGARRHAINSEPLLKKLQRRRNKAGDANSMALRELSRTVPTTLAGCLQSSCDYDRSPCRDIFTISLREDLERLAFRPT
jgi:hypothetical protein